MGMVFPLSTHNYELRYWLAAAGIHPGLYTNGDTTGTQGADVLISVTPPPQMPATLAQGTIQGYSVGEPWNQQAVVQGHRRPRRHRSRDLEEQPREGVRRDARPGPRRTPRRTCALVKALIRAGQWLDASPENRKQAVAILARPEYVGADAAVIANSMTGFFEYEKGDRREMPDFNVFFRDFATYPVLQRRRLVPDADAALGPARRSRSPTPGTTRRSAAIYRPDVWRAAAERLVAEGRLGAADLPQTDGYAPPDGGFIDGVVYDGSKPNAYLRSLAIGLKD